MKPPRIVQHPDPKVQDHFDKINKVLGKISYGSSIPSPTTPGATIVSNTEPDRNLDIWKLSGTTPGTADTDFTLAHGLGRVPGTIVGQDTNNGGLLYRGSVPWNTTQVTFRCTKATSNFIVYLG